MSTCICGAATFADFDRCVQHVPHWALVAEVTYLRARLLAANNWVPERSRHEHDHAAPAERSETTILERMG